MIVYFSGTGNSRWCGAWMADRLDDELVDAFHFIRDGIAAQLYSAKPWVFVSPTYAWRLPRIFRDFIRAGRFQGSTKAYFVMTCGDSIGNAARSNRLLCAEKGFCHRGTLEVVMPENYIAMFQIPGPEKCRHLVEQAGDTLERACCAVAAQRSFAPKRVGPVGMLESGPINPLFYQLIVGAKKFYTTTACIGCGKCVEVCPFNNISLREGRPLWGKHCTHCMACICLCPASAIEYGKRSLGKPRYQGPKYETQHHQRP